ncbi:hypothetical protein BDD12DRAFT_941483 [Trichophaea hybrida]|nr:hypothetical protein BDD12DRAFT_941483 [Trichophaea hybrida]
MSSRQGLWTEIIYQDWTTRFVTICTAVLRICIRAQVLLIPEDNIGMMSIYQYANAGPLDIAVPYILGAKMGKNPLGLLAVMLLALAGILTQFASTIILSDFEAFVLWPAQDTVRELNFTFPENVPMSGREEFRNLFTSSPIQYPVFTDRIIINHNKSVGGLVYSGNVTRAVSFARGRTSNYSILSWTGASIEHTNPIQIYDKTAALIQFSGQFDSVKAGSYSHQLFSQSSWTLFDKGDIYFSGVENCTFSATRMNFCLVGSLAGAGGVPTSQWILVSVLYAWEMANITNLVDHSPQHLVDESYDGTEWTNQTFAPVDAFGSGLGRRTHIMHSLCTTYSGWGSGDIEVETTHNYTEPKLMAGQGEQVAEWDPTNGIFWPTVRHGTGAVQKQFGVDGPNKRSNQERGILALPSLQHRRSFEDVHIQTAITNGSFIGAIAEIDNIFNPFVETLFLRALIDTRQLSFIRV